MPRQTSKGECNPVKLPIEVVANVNNENGGQDSQPCSSQDSARAVTPERITRSKGGNNKGERKRKGKMSKSPVAKRQKKNEQQRRVELQNCSENEAEPTVTFREGDQLIEMSVPRDGNESFLQSETEGSESEGEMEDNADETQNESPDDEQVQKGQGHPGGGEEEVATDCNRETIEDSEVSEEEKIKKIDRDLQIKMRELQALMKKRGLTGSAEVLQGIIEGEVQQIPTVTKKKKKGKKGNNTNNAVNILHVNDNQNASLTRGQGQLAFRVQSEETIYDNAIPSKRNSSSSEEGLVNTSDEFEKDGEMEVNTLNDLEALITDKRCEVDKRDPPMVMMAGEPQPGTSGENLDHRENVNTPPRPQRMNAFDNGMNQHTQQMLREAEAAKARIHATAGRNLLDTYFERNSVTVMDERYIVVGAHVEEPLVQKISRDEYVDFGKLIPKDRVMAEEDGRLEMHVKDGRTFWAPVQVTSNINNFTKWEQAFRVFANIYTKVNPHRSSELIEYNHIINMASLSFTWDNVYMYDKEFHLHMARNPQRSWAIILQQAWSMRLKDRLHRSDGNAGYTPGGHSNRGKSGEPCHCLNRGHCNFGSNCRYDQRCSYCFKFGHGAVNCRRAQNDRSDKNDRSGGIKCSDVASPFKVLKREDNMEKK